MTPAQDGIIIPPCQLWSQQLELFLGVHESKLRFFSQEKELVPTPQERAIAAQQQAEAERQQRELAQQRVEELLARLKELGAEPDTPEEH